MLDKLKGYWDAVKAWFKYSETIFWARANILTGLITTVVGSVDWSPIFNILGTDTGFSRNQVVWTGVGIFFNGIVTEIARRRNSGDLTK